MKKIKYILFLAFNIFFANNFSRAQSTFKTPIETALHNSNYIICIDGGGSKTELQILDNHGNLVALKQNDTSTYSIKASGSNINVVGKNGIKNTLDALLNNLKIEKTNIELKSIASQCAVVGGFSGGGSLDAKNTIKNLFKEYNFDENKIIVTSDADMAMESVAGDGIILISGTGSICFGKKGTEIIRVGGLGRFIGDEGSGYYIGIHAVKAALKDEYGWGRATSLKNALRTYFKTQDLKTIIPPFYRGEITNYQIASIAPIVFTQAELNDSLAAEIINEAAQELGKMLALMIQYGKFSNCPIYFFGGTFKNKNASQFTQKIFKSANIENWVTFNRAEANPTVLAVQRILNASN